MTWRLNLYLLVNFSFYDFRLHERATVAMRGRVDSKIIFEHLQNMKNEHLENSFLKPDQEQIINRLLIELKFRGFELEVFRIFVRQAPPPQLPRMESRCVRSQGLDQALQLRVVLHP